MPLNITDELVADLQRMPDSEVVKVYGALSDGERRELSAAIDARRFMTTPKRQTYSAPESALKGLEQGATLGLSDELGAFLQGGAQWVYNKLPGTYEQDVGDVYRQARGENRQIYDEAQKDNPKAYLGGELASAMLIPGGTAGLMGAVKTGAKLGAGAGFGYSEGDLTSGDLGDAGRVLRDTALGAGLGAGGGALGHGLSNVTGKAIGAFTPSKFLQGKTDKAVAEALQAQEALAQKGLRSASGELGGESGAVLHIVEKAKSALNDPLATEAQKLKAQQILDDPEIVRAAQRAYDNLFGPRAADKVRAMGAAEEGLEVARKAAAPDAVQAATDQSLAHPIKEQVWPRVRKHLIDRALLPGIGGLAGAFMGENSGSAAVGGLAGHLVAQAMGGRPSSAMERMLRNPSVRNMWWGGLKKVLVDAPESLGRFARPLLQAASRGDEQLAATHYVLAQMYPEFREKMKELEDGQLAASAGTR